MTISTRAMLAGLALGAALLAGPVLAQDFDAAYDNTVVVTVSGGDVLRYYFEPDGSFRAIMPDGAEISGNWEIDGAEICFTGNDEERSCAPYVEGKQVGDSWNQPGIGGDEVGVAIVAGRD